MTVSCVSLGCALAWIVAGMPGSARAQDGIDQPTMGKSRAAVVVHAAKPAAARTQELSIGSLGGGLQNARLADLFAPFSQQSRVQINLSAWDGNLATLQRRAQTGVNAGSASWGLVLMEDAPVQVACREGLLISRPATANPADEAPDSSGRDCGVSAWRTSLVLAWDKSRVEMVPTWSDFWDVARRPGKRGLRRDVRGTLEIALMADGVAPDDVYRTLASGEGVDRAFRKLDQLKPYIVWWNMPVEAVQIIESGAVLMTSATSGEVATADQTGHRSFGTQWAQSLSMTYDWAVPRQTTPEQRTLAQGVLAFMADPAQQAVFLEHHQAMPPEASAAGATSATNDPGTPDHPHAALVMDDSFWADHLVTLRRRFESWIEAK